MTASRALHACTIRLPLPRDVRARGQDAAPGDELPRGVAPQRDDGVLARVLATRRRRGDRARRGADWTDAWRRSPVHADKKAERLLYGGGGEPEQALWPPVEQPPGQRVRRRRSRGWASGTPSALQPCMITMARARDAIAACGGHTQAQASSTRVDAGREEGDAGGQKAERLLYGGGEPEQAFWHLLSATAGPAVFACDSSSLRANWHGRIAPLQDPLAKAQH
jgi:hypothetical protein